MGRALTEQGGFSLVGDKVHVDRRQAELRNLVTAFLEAAEQADLAVIYLAGYCERRPSDQQLFYLAMSARGDRATALHNEALGLHDAVLLPAAEVLARNPRLRLVTMVDNYVAPTLVGHYDRAPENPTRLDLPPRTLLSISSKPHKGATATMVRLGAWALRQWGPQPAVSAASDGTDGVFAAAVRGGPHERPHTAGVFCLVAWCERAAAHRDC